MKRLFIFHLFALLSLFAYAQAPVNPAGNGTIKGRVVDSATGAPVEYATISLMTQDGNTVVNGTTADDKGAFKITDIAFGTYKLAIVFFGYRTFEMNNVVLSKSNSTLTLGNIKLANTAITLNKATVVADKSTIENKIDKIVYNVDKDLTAQGGVATDALKKVPEVSVDVDGNVELQGNSNIRFLINGKPSTMFGTNLADVLQSIPASEIQSIEVITSPGAKYDAEGIGGIINIILKKVTAQGINGNLSASVGTLLENGSFNLNAKKGKFGAHAFFNANARLNATVNTNSTRTGQDTNNQTSNLLQNGTSQFTRGFYQGGGGVDWDITPKDNISASVSYNHFQVSGSGTTTKETIEQDMYGNTLSDVNNLLLSTNTFNMHNIDGSADYKKTFLKEGQELDVSYNISSGTYNSYYSQAQEDIPSEYTFNGSYGLNPATSLENTASIDYAQPLDTNGTLLEMGAKADVNALSSTSNVYLLNTGSGNYDYNGPQSTGIDYTTSVYAGYLSASFKLLKWLDVKAGYRYEYTMINAAFANIGNVNVPAYGTNVPSITISHKYSGNQTLKLSYSHRIQRPDGEDLNPFVNATDPQNISTGNPNLQPEIGNKIEFGYNKIFNSGGNLFITLFYRGNIDDIQPYTVFYPSYKVGDSTYSNVAVTTSENIGHEDNYGLSVYGTIPFTPKFNLRTNVSLFQRYIVTGFPTGGNISGFNYRINMNATYEFNDDLSFEAFANFNSPRVNAQGTYPQFFNYTFAFRKQLFHKKASIAATATNPFNKYVTQTTNLTGDNFTLVTTRQLPYQSFGINFTYKFGKLEFKPDKQPEDNNQNQPEGGN